MAVMRTMVDTNLAGWFTCLLCGVTTRHDCCDLEKEPAVVRLLVGMMLPTLYVSRQVQSRFDRDRRVKMTMKTPWGTELTHRRWDDDSHCEAVAKLARVFIIAYKP